MCSLIRHNHETHTFSLKVILSVDIPLKYRFVIENDYTPYIIMNNIFLTYSKIVMSRDSDRWLETITFKINSLYIDQVWTMIEAPMGMTQQIANRNVNLNFCYCYTPSREFISSGRQMYL